METVTSSANRRINVLMRKTIFRAYGFVSILFMFLFLYGLLNLRLAVQRKESLTGCVEITDYSRTVVQDYEAPVGETNLFPSLKPHRVGQLAGHKVSLFLGQGNRS